MGRRSKQSGLVPPGCKEILKPLWAYVKYPHVRSNVDYADSWGAWWAAVSVLHFCREPLCPPWCDHWPGGIPAPRAPTGRIRARSAQRLQQQHSGNCRWWLHYTPPTFPFVPPRIYIFMCILILYCLRGLNFDKCKKHVFTLNWTYTNENQHLTWFVLWLLLQAL